MNYEEYQRLYPNPDRIRATKHYGWKTAWLQVFHETFASPKCNDTLDTYSVVGVYHTNPKHCRAMDRKGSEHTSFFKVKYRGRFEQGFSCWLLLGNEPCLEWHGPDDSMYGDSFYHESWTPCEILEYPEIDKVYNKASFPAKRFWEIVYEAYGF